MSIEDDTVHFIHNASMYHTAQLSHYDAANRRRRTLDFISERLSDETESNQELLRRITKLEAEVAEGEVLLEWHADRYESCRRMHDEALKETGVEAGARDPTAVQAFKERWPEVRRDTVWQERRAGLSQRRLERLRRAKTGGA